MRCLKIIQNYIYDNIWPAIIPTRIFSEKWFEIRGSDWGPNIPVSTQIIPTHFHLNLNILS